MIKKQVLRVSALMMMSLPSLGMTGFVFEGDEPSSPIAVSNPQALERIDSLDPWMPILEDGNLIVAIQSSQNWELIDRVITASNAIRDTAYPLLVPEGVLENASPQPLPGSPSATSSRSGSDDDSEDEDEEDRSPLPTRSPSGSDGDAEEEEVDGSDYGSSADGEEAGGDSGEEADDDSDEDDHPALAKKPRVEE